MAIGLGSNIGDRRAHLDAAAARLDALLDRLRCSHIYETAPLHVVDQPAFLNACCAGLTDLSPTELLLSLKEIERALGRIDGGKRYGPRRIDLDILLYDEEIVRTSTLTIPHPRLHERAFALVPLAEVAPNWQHHEKQRSIVELRDAVPADGVRPTGWKLTPSRGAEDV